ncbi:hypothetical protein GCM10009836_59420 [Pseudonocardia ailaonensis]|uniref:DUF397 domain-containing protein n=1 Tax=Pseudonocardia ailaonensis TaxID=367279 RepID=A0ABN2NIL0_9PSEU
MSAEPGPVYVRSSACSMGSCVEVTRTSDGMIRIRNSTEPDQSLRFSREEWSAFLVGVRGGEFDFPDG